MTDYDYEIVVVEASRPGRRRWSTPEREAKKLAEVVPAQVAERWRKVRRDMTSGLRRRIRQARN